jgi:glycosyltransferase involved in cell wall biosynthesis
MHIARIRGAVGGQAAHGQHVARRSSMHVAMISTSCVPVPPPRYGGTELVIHELVRALVHRGHRVTVYATGDSKPSGELRSYFQHAVWPPDLHLELIHAHWACFDLLRRRDRPDVVHMHTPVALTFAQSLHLPVVYTVHHQREQHFVDFYRYFGDADFAMISKRQSELHPEIDHRHVVHHGVDPAAYVPGDGGGGYLAFLGRFAPEKGPHIAIDVARAAGVPLIMAGDVHPHEQLFFEREMLPRLDLDGVRWIGEADHTMKQTLLGGARATLFPIDWEEPFGLVMIESMLCGTPVIAFKRGSAPEVVENGVTGFIVDTPAEMVRAVRDARSLDRAAIRRRAEMCWSADRMAGRYLQVYERAIARKRGMRWIGQNASDRVA